MFSEALQELQVTPDEYANFELEGIFSDVVHQLRAYYLLSRDPMGDGFKFGRQELSIDDYFAQGLRVHVPAGALVYNSAIEQRFGSSTNLLFDQIYAQLKSLKSK